MRLIDPDQGLTVDIDGEVVWRQTRTSKPGFGVRFILTDANIKRSIAALFDQVELRIA